MSIKVYHLAGLTSLERDELNSVGWDGSPRFRRYADVTCRGNKEAVIKSLLHGEYIVVAVVDTDSKDVAYEKTNHITSDWRENESVTAIPGVRARSTSVGDIMETESGEIYVVSHVGFTPLY